MTTAGAMQAAVSHRTGGHHGSHHDGTHDDRVGADGAAAAALATPGETTASTAISLASRILIAPIRGYQRFISPYLPPTCRYYPSCSSYAATALTEHGAVRGMWLAVRRLARCHPWHDGGFDPVPPRKGTT